MEEEMSKVSRDFFSKKKMSIRTRITSVFFLALIVLSILFIPIISGMTRSQILENTEFTSEQILRQLSNSIELYFTEVSKLSKHICEDISSKKFSGPEGLAALLKTIKDYRSDIVSLAFIKNNGKAISADPEDKLNPSWNCIYMDWYRNAIKACGDAVISGSHVSPVFLGRYPWVISISRAVIIDGKAEGVLLIELNYGQIEAICSKVKLPGDGYVYIQDDRYDLVYHPKQQLMSSGIKSEPKFTVGSKYENQALGKLYISKRSPSTEWTLIVVVGLKALSGFRANTWTVFLMLLSAYLLIYFATAFAFHSNVYMPLEELMSSIKALRKGNLKVRADIKSGNEFDTVGAAFNEMADTLLNLMAERKKMEAEKRKGDIRTLQAQIRPHFLYNTLESIIWMAEIGEDEAVISMTSSLSRLLRAGSRNEDGLTNLGTEVQYIRDYLYLQKMRFGDKLSFEISIPENLKYAVVLFLSLQPLVENSISHGIKPLKKDGRIFIDAWTMAHFLFLRVSDNGNGIDMDALIKKGELPESSNGEDGGIGLRNVLERIHLYFGRNYGIIFRSKNKSFSPESRMDDMDTVNIPPLNFKAGIEVILKFPLNYSDLSAEKETKDDNNKDGSEGGSENENSV